MDDLTDRQRDVFRFIWDRAVSGESMPTIREIGKEFGIKSPNGVVSNLAPLFRKGYLRHDYGKSRGYVLQRRPDGRPFLGFVPREEPDPAGSHAELLREPVTVEEG